MCDLSTLPTADLWLWLAMISILGALCVYLVAMYAYNKGWVAGSEETSHTSEQRWRRVIEAMDRR